MRKFDKILDVSLLTGAAIVLVVGILAAIFGF